MSKIEQLIGEIEEYIDGCKLQPFSSTKIIVDKAQLEELLTELRHRTPDEIPGRFHDCPGPGRAGPHCQ